MRKPQSLESRQRAADRCRTGTELRDLRRRTGLGCVAFGAALGIGGNGRNIARCLRRLEGLGDRRLPDYAIERAEAVIREERPDTLRPNGGVLFKNQKHSSLLPDHENAPKKKGVPARCDPAGTRKR